MFLVVWTFGCVLTQYREGNISEMVLEEKTFAVKQSKGGYIGVSKLFGVLRSAVRKNIYTWKTIETAVNRMSQQKETKKY